MSGWKLSEFIKVGILMLLGVTVIPLCDWLDELTREKRKFK